MFTAGEYVEVRVNGQWVVARVRRMVGNMVIAYRADGFIWLGDHVYVNAV